MDGQVPRVHTTVLMRTRVGSKLFWRITGFAVVHEMACSFRIGYISARLDVLGQTSA